MPKFVVTVCAADSAGGGVIVPAVAQRLGVAHQALTAPRSLPGAGDDALDDEEFRARSERDIAALRSSGGVIRDAPAAFLLADDPSVLRVRLDGPLAARARQGVAATGKPLDEVRHLIAARDEAWAAYHRTNYGIDITEPRWYHMILDSTALDWNLCAELIELAARSLDSNR